MRRIFRAITSLILAVIMAINILPYEKFVAFAEEAGVIYVSAGSFYSLAVKSDASLWAWGGNGFGQLGDGTMEPKYVHTRIMDDVKIAVASHTHSLAIKKDGSLWAWGQNSNGQLGDGTRESKYLPIKIMDGVLDAAAGSSHTLAIKDDGTLWAWGNNTFGQLGDGTKEDKTTPVKIMDGVKTITAYGNYSFALKEDGSLWAWGQNDGGYLANGTTENCLTPEKIMDNVILFGGSWLFMAVKSDGSLWSWTADWSGQAIKCVPTKIDNNVLAVTGGYYIKNDNSLWSWDGESLPAKIMDEVKMVSSSYRHALIIKNDGSVYAVGENSRGELGDGTTLRRDTPVIISIQTDSGQTSISEGAEKITNSSSAAVNSVNETTTESAQSTESGVIAVAAGNHHSLALKEDGSLWEFGQIWNNSGYESNKKPNPEMILNDVVSIASGPTRYLAIKSDGGLWAWGYDYTYAQSAAAMESSTTPMRVLGNVVSAAAGVYHSLAVKTDGSLWGWGSLSRAQKTDEPVKIMDDVRTVAVGEIQSLALKNDGSVWAWHNGVTGAYDSESVYALYSETPEKVMDDVIFIAAGEGVSFAVKSDNSLWAWGKNSHGQLGDGTTTDRVEPVKIMDDVTSVSVGYFDSFSVLVGTDDGKFLPNVMIVKTDGSLWGWGDNSFGQLSDGTTEDKTYPVKIMDDAKAVSAGGMHILMVKNDGSLWSWGNNTSGQLGNGESKQYILNDKDIPEKIMDNVTDVAISSAGHHTLVLKSDKSLWAMGENKYGQIGNGTTDNTTDPVKIMDDVSAISAGSNHSIALKTDGSVWAWGYNAYGAVGDGTRENRNSPLKVMDGVKMIAAGASHNLALKADGSVWAWGYNNYGQIGNGDKNSGETKPIKIMDNAVSIMASSEVSLAFKTDGSLLAWGNDGNYFLDLRDVITDVPIKLSTSMLKFEMGFGHALILKDDESLWTRGNNYHGQIGNGVNGNDYYAESSVKIMDDVIAISAANNSSFAVKTDGSLWAWGENKNRQLGDGTTEDKNKPTKIMDDVSVVAASTDTTLVLKTDGSLWGWGKNDHGQLGGSGTVVINANSYTPIKVMDGTVKKDEPSSWAVEFVNSSVMLGLVPTTLQSSYTKPISRAEFCALAVTLYETVTGSEITERKIFDDTKDVNVEKAVAIGVASGVGDNKFAPDNQLTREQAAVMLSRLAEILGKALPKHSITFSDDGVVSPWAVESVGQIQAAGIMSGTGDNMFSPQDPYTREQSIITILRLYDMVK